MDIQKIAKKTYKVRVDLQNDFDLNGYYDDLIYLEKRKILTFGDTNFRIFENYFCEKGYKVRRLDLCLDDDKSIGLEMPKTWYLNKGKHALSTAMYYNYLNHHGVVETKDFATFNKDIVKDFGRLSCIEVYFEDELKRFLKKHHIKYFGTPKTLTECIRYLEGWSLEKYPRLKGYATFSKFIKLWSEINFPDFNRSEWLLGKDQSRKINKVRPTNVRLAVKYFWKNYLLKVHGGILEEDREIDILGGEKFYNIRSPKIILLSEDLFSDQKSDCEIFKNLTKKLSIEKMYLSKKKNNFPEKNAMIARKIFPDSLIIILENDEKVSRNFSLISQIKYSINQELVITTKVLKHVIDNYV